MSEQVPVRYNLVDWSDWFKSDYETQREPLSMCYHSLWDHDCTKDHASTFRNPVDVSLFHDHLNIPYCLIYPHRFVVECVYVFS